MLRDVQNCTSALDFGVDTPVGPVGLFMPQQASPGVTSPGGASLAGCLPGGVTLEGSSPPPAPTPASAALRANNGHANRGTVGVTPAVTCSRAASILPVSVAIRNGGGRNNNRAHGKGLGIDRHWKQPAGQGPGRGKRWDGGTARYARSPLFYPATRAEDFESGAKMDYSTPNYFVIHLSEHFLEAKPRWRHQKSKTTAQMG